MVISGILKSHLLSSFMDLKDFENTLSLFNRIQYILLMALSCCLSGISSQNDKTDTHTLKIIGSKSIPLDTLTGFSSLSLQFIDKNGSGGCLL
jgi:hypothetical protein